MWREDSGGGSDPPPIPPDALSAPRHRRWKRTTVATVALLALICVGVVTCVRAQLWRMNESTRQETCASNLSVLAAIYVAAALENRVELHRRSGSALWLAMRKDGVKVGRGQENLLLCPGDGSVDRPSPGQIPAWDEVNLDDPPRELCSYAGRDFASFPIDDSLGQPHAIGACIHHRGVAIVAFDDGSVRKMGREELGLAPDDDIVCGPESKSRLLRQLLGGN